MQGQARRTPSSGHVGVFVGCGTLTCEAAAADSDATMLMVVDMVCSACPGFMFLVSVFMCVVVATFLRARIVDPCSGTLLRVDEEDGAAKEMGIAMMR